MLDHFLCFNSWKTNIHSHVGFTRFMHAYMHARVRTLAKNNPTKHTHTYTQRDIQDIRTRIHSPTHPKKERRNMEIDKKNKRHIKLETNSRKGLVGKHTRYHIHTYVYDKLVSMRGVPCVCARVYRCIWVTRECTQISTRLNTRVTSLRV